MPLSGAIAAARERPSSVSAKRPGRSQCRPSGRRTDRFAKRCTTSSDMTSPSKRQSTTRPLSAPRSTAANALVEVEDLTDRRHRGVGRIARRELEERGHLLLPARIDLGARHRLEYVGELLALQVADQQPVLAQEQRIVAPARVP